MLKWPEIVNKRRSGETLKEIILSAKYETKESELCSISLLSLTEAQLAADKRTGSRYLKSLKEVYTAVGVSKVNWNGEIIFRYFARNNNLISRLQASIFLHAGPSLAFLGTLSSLTLTNTKITKQELDIFRGYLKSGGLPHLSKVDFQYTSTSELTWVIYPNSHNMMLLIAEFLPFAFVSISENQRSAGSLEVEEFRTIYKILLMNGKTDSLLRSSQLSTTAFRRWIYTVDYLRLVFTVLLRLNEMSSNIFDFQNKLQYYRTGSNTVFRNEQTDWFTFLQKQAFHRETSVANV